MIFVISILLISLLGSSYCASIPTIVDLTYTYNNDTPNYPTHSKFKLLPIKNTVQKYGFWIAINDICTSEHSGTHMDAPQHFIKGARTVENIPPENLYRLPGVKIDIRHKIKDNVNYPITGNDIREWIDQNGPIPDGGFVLFQTGQGEMAHDAQLYSGMDDNGGLNFPGLGKSAAEFLVSYKSRNRLSKGVIGMGMDSLSLDVGKAKTDADFVSHYELLGNDIYGLENVANVHKLPARGFYVTVSPMKIGYGSGGPTRVFAEIVRNAANVKSVHWISLLVSLVISLTISFVNL